MVELDLHNKNKNNSKSDNNDDHDDENNVYQTENHLNSRDEEDEHVSSERSPLISFSANTKVTHLHRPPPPPAGGGGRTSSNNATASALLSLFDKPSSSPTSKSTSLLPLLTPLPQSRESRHDYNQYQNGYSNNNAGGNHEDVEDDTKTLRAGVGGNNDNNNNNHCPKIKHQKQEQFKNDPSLPLNFSKTNHYDGIPISPQQHQDSYTKLKDSESWEDEITGVPLSSVTFPNNHNNHNNPIKNFYSKCISTLTSLTTSKPTSKTPPLLSFFIGSVTSALYHCVFSLAMASSLTRTHPPSSSASSLLGPMAKMTALGVIVTSPLQIIFLGKDTPALYPSADLFLAPFLSEMAHVVDEDLYQKRIASSIVEEEDDDTFVFLATFALLAAIGMAFSSALCVLAAKVKLANLGAFLPHAVICGFFSSIGVLVWTLSFSVDNNGAKVQDVLHQLFSSSSSTTTTTTAKEAPSLATSLIHHAPSFVAGLAMKVLCPRNAIWMPVLICVIVMGFYAIMGLTGTSLKDAQEGGWFWTTEELVGVSNEAVAYSFGPPAPFGVILPLLQNNIDYDAVLKGLPTAAAMALIYTLRCSLHAVALKKLSDQLVKKKEKYLENNALASSSSRSLNKNNSERNSKRSSLYRQRGLSFTTTMTNTSWGDNSHTFDDNFAAYGSSSTNINGGGGGGGGYNDSCKNKKLNNLRTLLWYGVGHLISAVVGGFTALPAFAIGATLFELGVEGLAPQYGGIIILLYCYCSNFSIINYIPKAVFSSLLVLGFLEFTWKWMIQSYTKTKSKWEWLVVPAIVIIAFVVPLLEAVVIGLAASTFIFVGAFYKSGIVKYASTGLTVRSTVDRMDDDLDILDCSGDLIQILVLQNYVFFGNASSCLQYIQTMFEEPEIDKHIDFQLPPVPKYIVLDFNLVTGIDTSSVDIFAEIITLCREESCALLFSGLSRDFRSTLACGGVKPIPNHVVYCYDLETALGKAEDGLLHEAHKSNMNDMELPLSSVSAGGGFQKALVHIEAHQGIYVTNLYGLEKYTRALTVSPGEYLQGSALNPNGGIIPDSDRGLFFIEEGMLKIIRDPGCSYSLTRNRNKQGNHQVGMSLTGMNARSATLGNIQNLLKTINRSTSSPSRTFRLAKIGPGWVIGAVEGCSGIRNPGLYSAITKCQLFHLPYHLLPQIEKDDPILALNLFKLLAHIVSRRQMSAIEQMGNLHSIITSSPVMTPRCRLTMGAINNAMHYVDN